MRYRDAVEERSLIYPFKLPACNAPIVDSASSEQQKAIEMTFTEPISYIWGAPGTGKTRCVLAQSIIACMQRIKQSKNASKYNREKIIIVAPTNNAVEQVLEGVIFELKKNNMYFDNCILRLGQPSASFAQKYPECIERTKRTIILSKKRQQLNQLKEAKKQKNNLFLLINLTTKVLALTAEKSACKFNLTDFEKNRLAVSENIFLNDCKLKKLDKFIFKFFYSAKIEKLKNENKFFCEEISELEEKICTEKTKIKNISSGITDCVEEISAILENSKFPDAFYQVFKKQDLVTLRAKAETEYKNTILKIDAIFFQYPSWKSLTDDEIEVKIEKYSKSVAQEVGNSTSKLVEKSDVIACTIDTLISRVFSFNEKKAKNYTLSSESDTSPIFINALHIFMDEAAYCPVIKTPVLFAFGCPVTLLGDHMQLPPVCELNGIAKSKTAGDNYDKIALWDIPSFYVDKMCFKTQKLIENYKKSTLNTPSLPTSALTTSYRFGAKLANVLDKFVYKNGLSSNVGNNTEIYFLDSPLKKEREIKKQNPRTNLEEIEAIEKLFLNSNIINSNYAILTPYKNQQNLLRSALESKFPKNDFRSSVLTVHKSQGQEWDNVIFSVVDRDKKSLWYTTAQIPKSNGTNLINTSVSRAKKRVILVLDKEFWSSEDVKGDFINELLSVAKPLDCIKNKNISF